MAAQSFGEGFVPLLLGFIAQAFGIPSVFYLVGIAGIAIIIAVLWILIIRPQRHLVVS
jgi:fucose permease